MKVFDLVSVNGRKSFYGKAKVLQYEDGTEILLSYNTEVIKRNPDGSFVRLWGDWSATTGTHIRAFCGMDKKEFEKLPMA